MRGYQMNLLGGRIEQWDEHNLDFDQHDWGGCGCFAGAA